MDPAVDAIRLDVQNALAAAPAIIPASRFTSQRPGEDAATPLGWLHPGSDLGALHPSMPFYRQGEVIFEAWVRNQVELAEVERRLNFLGSWYKGTAGTPPNQYTGLRYRLATVQRLPEPETTDWHLILTYEVLYYDARTA